MSGKLIVISGPSGVGKGSVLNELVKTGDYGFSVSMTTRKPRPGEVNGESYFFVSQEEFDKTIEEGGFLEYVRKFEHSYGTPKQAVFDMLSSGKNVIFDIEMEGAINLKKAYPEAVLIFMIPPNLQALAERLRKRNSETEEEIAIRQKDIQKEIAQIVNYDYYVVNDTIEAAIESVKAIVSGNAEEYKITNPQEIIDRFKEA